MHLWGHHDCCNLPYETIIQACLMLNYHATRGSHVERRWAIRPGDSRLVETGTSFQGCYCQQFHQVGEQWPPWPMRLIWPSPAVSHPSTTYCFPSWHFHVVIQALTRPPFELLCETLLKFLTIKVLFLVALTSTSYVSELGALSGSPGLCHIDKVVLWLDLTFILVLGLINWCGNIFCPKLEHLKERLAYFRLTQQSVHLYSEDGNVPQIWFLVPQLPAHNLHKKHFSDISKHLVETLYSYN